MWLNFKALCDADNSGILKVSRSKSGVVTLNGNEITEDEANKFAMQFVTERYSDSVTSMQRLLKVVRGLNKGLSDPIKENLSIEYYNKPDRDYGKSFDRVSLQCKGLFNVTIIHGCSTASASYIVYRAGSTEEVGHFSNMSAVTNCLNHFKMFSVW